MRVLRIALLAVGLGGCAFDALDQADVDDTFPPPTKDAGRDSGNGFLLDAGIAFPGFVDGGRPPPPTPKRLVQSLRAEHSPPALSGGTLAVAQDGSYAVAADPDRDRVYVIDLAGQGTAKALQLPAGSEPGRVVLDDKGRAHVALRGGESVLSLDLASARQLALTPVCSLPRGLAYDAARDALVIACASGELLTIAADTHAPIADAQLGLDLRDVILKDDGSLLVSRYRSAELLRVNSAGNVETLKPQSVKQQRFQSFEGDGGSFGSVVDITMSPTLAWKTVALPDGGALMLHQASQENEIGLGEGASGSYGGGCETITQPVFSVIDTDLADSNLAAPSTLMPHGLAVDVAASPDGRWIAVAEPGAYLQAQPTVELFDQGSLGFMKVCVGGFAISGDYQATSVAFDAAGQLYVFSREPASLHVYTDVHDGFGFFAATREFALALESVRDTGHDLFHADVGSGLSCAGCHGEALDDGHVWNFKGFGPRRTQTMRGGLLSTLPLHWEGDLPTFQNLVDEVMTRRMGGFVVEPQFGEALAKWIDEQPAVQLGAPTDAAAARGKALFESTEVGCATCHSGAHLTNNLSADVGTGGVFQVPTLLGIALHPPFMHDGCAATLEARFVPGCGGGDAHGHTSQLSAAQTADLISYLKTL
jgi:DNA-binding beta-propeller fold protein YncE/mono/diheme cytochrome c family protein